MAAAVFFVRTVMCEAVKDRLTSPAASDAPRVSTCIHTQTLTHRYRDTERERERDKDTHTQHTDIHSQRYTQTDTHTNHITCHG